MGGMKCVGKDVRNGEKRTIKDMTVITPMAIQCWSYRTVSIN